MRLINAAAAVLCASIPCFESGSVGAETDKVAFPANYMKGVMYTSHDLVQAKEYRELYITPAALDAARQDLPLPSGTVITLARYAVQLEANGNPAKDANRRFIKKELKAFRVMEERTGWGTEYQANKRNGEWEYQAFLPDRTADTKANPDSCFQCHKNGDSANFMF